MWTQDENIRTYERLCFKPKLKAPNGQYNIWTGFETEPKEGDWSIVKEIMTHTTGKDPVVFDYVMKWMAHVVQYPSIKTGVCLVIQGKQGAGKDTLFDFFGSLLGSAYFYNTKSPEKDVFCTFTEHLQRVVFLKFEEANFESNKRNADMLKSFITCEKDNFQPKGRKSVTLDNYTNVVMTHNPFLGVNVEEGNRRFCLIQASDDLSFAKGGEKARLFWKQAHKQLKSQEVKEAFMHHLLNIDLSDFDVKDFPITDYARDVKASLRPYHAKSMQKIVECQEEFGIDCDTVEYKPNALLKKVNDDNKFEISDTKLGRDMKEYPAEALSKHRSSSGQVYKVHLKEMRKFLQAQGWWVEL